MLEELVCIGDGLMVSKEMNVRLSELVILTVKKTVLGILTITNFCCFPLIK